MESYSFQPSRTIIPFVIIALVAIGGFFILRSVNTYIRYMGYHDCGQISQYEQTLPDQNVTVRYPLEDVYEKCLVDKGLSASNKE